MTQLPVIYMAAGRGVRLGELTAERPKALLEVGGSSLLERALINLRVAGVERVVAVTGYAAEVFNAFPVETRFNDRWADQNNVVSLWSVRDVVRDGCLIVNCDVLFELELARRLVAAHGTSLLVDDKTPVDQESMKVTLDGERIVRLHKSVPLDQAVGEYIGLTRVDPADGSRLAEVLEEFVARGEVDVYYEDALAALAAERQITIQRIGGLNWIEIDDEEDLRRARDQVAPAVDRIDGPVGTVAAK